ncbi:MAG: alpha/beta hydrolase family esterase [Rudaea sp.]
MKRGYVCFALALCGATPGLALSAQSVTLPTWVCAHPDAIYASAFQSGEIAVPHAPSNGSGGAYPGNVTRVVNVSGFGNQTYYLYLPPAYTPTRAWPAILVLHGAGGPGTSDSAAQQVRSDWSSTAATQQFIVISVVGTNASGGWSPGSDVPIMSAQLDDAQAKYNIDADRIYLWGFSAGAHLAHALGLNNTDYFAAYGVSAGGLTQYACSDDGSFSPSCAALLGGVARKIPVDIHLGDSDPLYTTYGAGNDPARFESYGWVLNQDLYYTLFSGGHTYTIPQLGDIWHNLCPNAVVP